jgi:uncharacterized protein
MSLLDLSLVIDTNVLLVSIPQHSPHHWLFESLTKRQFKVFLTTEILSEYEEIISRKLGRHTADLVIRTLIELSNVIPVTIHFRYQFIQADPDDDKFVNCAVNANADFILTHDKHFDILKNISFPVIKTITLEELKPLLKQ